MKHISVNFLQNSFIDMIRKMRIRYVKKYINPALKRKNLKNSPFEFPLKLSSLEYHLDSRSLAENHRISCGRAGNKACRRCVLRVPLTGSFFPSPSSSFSFLLPLFFPSPPLPRTLVARGIVGVKSISLRPISGDKEGGHPAIFHRRVFTPFHRGYLSFEILSLLSTPFENRITTLNFRFPFPLFRIIHAKLAARSP